MKYACVIVATLISCAGISAMDHKMVNDRKKWKYTDYCIIPMIGIGSLCKRVRFPVLGLAAILYIDMICRNSCKYDQGSWHEKAIQKIDLKEDKSLQINDAKNIKEPKRYDSTYSWTAEDERDYRISENGCSSLDFIYHDIVE